MRPIYPTYRPRRAALTVFCLAIAAAAVAVPPEGTPVPAQPSQKQPAQPDVQPLTITPPPTAPRPATPTETPRTIPALPPVGPPLTPPPTPPTAPKPEAAKPSNIPGLVAIDLQAFQVGRSIFVIARGQVSDPRHSVSLVRTSPMSRPPQIQVRVTTPRPGELAPQVITNFEVFGTINNTRATDRIHVVLGNQTLVTHVRTAPELR